MIITCGYRQIETPCQGCPCHDNHIQFGDLVEGCCWECGCPKTVAAFTMAKEQADGE